ncbi:putative uncharacterized protein DDB_G0294196 [Uranotaenia lowii]|uniref:putative uncharacterized protein DDB_G0294196 n=1 Tax=Uranotaenia lowii TaxID=190385 RepID=UPI00247AC7D1|nr:putative uncharacterized protein DDB_G0294196 [Uranotaenia lowii]XP_055590119.1 putative uncharacterized protein DDB_G0294196 [Uranotaenia lowii]
MDNQARLAELQTAIIDRDDQIHQLRMELQGAVEAVQAAQAQPLRYQLPQPVGARLLQPPPRYQPTPRPHPSAFQPRPFQPMPRFFNPQPKPTPMDVDPSIRSRHMNYINRPHYQLEQEYAWYYPQDPSLHLYGEHSDPINSAEMEQQQPDQIYADTAEATTSEPSSADVPRDETDDLNFQAVTRLLPLA